MADIRISQILFWTKIEINGLMLKFSAEMHLQHEILSGTGTPTNNVNIFDSLQYFTVICAHFSYGFKIVH